MIVSVILVGSNEDVDSYDGKQRHQYSTTPPRMFHANVMREDEQKMPQKTACYLSLYCNFCHISRRAGCVELWNGE